ncbi:hypothetical protein NL676_029860 [Syzygium grande]|nr:hypothetical protein NL676_029860 [Syzygium grande]
MIDSKKKGTAFIFRKKAPDSRRLVSSGHGRSPVCFAPVGLQNQEENHGPTRMARLRSGKKPSKGALEFDTGASFAGGSTAGAVGCVGRNSHGDGGSAVGRNPEVLEGEKRTEGESDNLVQ